MNIRLTRAVRFSAGHRYWVPEWTGEENRRVFGASARPHGHDYVVEATVEGEIDRTLGMVVNITEVKAALNDAIEPLDGVFLDREHPLFRDRVPTTENLSLLIWERLAKRLAGCRPVRVRVHEKADQYCDNEGEGRTVYLTRRYEFSAAHRLHSDVLPDEENRRIFGKCNNPNGHGHNYGIDVTVAGEIDPVTGMIADLARLDEIVSRRAIDRMDHRHLNLDLPEFGSMNPTSENLAVVIWDLLRPELGESLAKIGIRETERNYFEYRGR